MLKIQKDDKYPNATTVIKYKESEVLASHSMLLLKGEPGTGKSRLAMNFMVGLLGGEDNLGFDYSLIPENKNVVYFSTEMIPYHIHRRMLKILENINPNFENKLHMFDMSVSTNLSDDINKALTEYPPHVLIIDQVGDWLNNGNVNDIEDANKLFKYLHWVCVYYNCAIIVILHQNQDSSIVSKARGHLGSLLEQKSVCSVAIGNNKNTGLYRIKATKIREGRLFDIPAEFNVKTMMLSSIESDEEKKDVLETISFPITASSLMEKYSAYYKKSISFARQAVKAKVEEGILSTYKVGREVYYERKSLENAKGFSKKEDN